MGHPISMKAASLLTEFLGNYLSKIDNELKKLSVILSAVSYTHLTLPTKA